MKLTSHIKSVLDRRVISLDEPVLVAVSGGVDSMVLLYVLQQLAVPLQVAHVNYHLREADSNLDQKVVEDYCKANEIQFHLLEPLMNSSTGIQEQARKVRYEWFEELCRANGLSKILTAHHLGDQAETVIFNLSRGAGLTGASGMKEEVGSIVRPFLEVSKEEINEFADSNGVKYRQDQSNFSVKYSRNRIRNNVIPELQQVNQSVMMNLGKFSRLSAQANLAMIEYSKLVWESNSSETEIGVHLDISNWSEKEYAELMLYYFLQLLRIETNLTTAVYGLLMTNSGKRVESKFYVIWKDRKKLVFEKKNLAVKSPFFLEVKSEGTYDILDGHLEISTAAFPEEFGPNSNVIYAAKDALEWPLIIRTWRPGDSFQPFGMKGRQKVSDYLTQKKVSMVSKKRILVMECKGEVIWVLGMRMSDKVKVSEGNGDVIQMLIIT